MQIEDVGGKDQFKDKLPALVKTSGFSNVEIFAVIRDADINANNAFRSVCNTLKKAGISPPGKVNQFTQRSPKVGIFVMPGNSEKGMLEDLCLETVKDTPAMACVTLFSECCQGNLQIPEKNFAKSKALAYLAAMPTIVNSVGLGAQCGYWDFNSEI